MVESAARPEKVEDKTPVANATEDDKAEVTEVEQPANCEETFNDAVVPEVKFRCDWTLWEHYESQGAKMDYASSMCKACWFNDMVSFATAWATIPHRDLTNIFFNDETKTIKL